jgi:type IV secretion system protein TrbL
MEQKKIILPIAVTLGLLVVTDTNLANAAYVADNNAAVAEITRGLSGGGAGFGTTFQTQLSNLSKGLLASARIIAVIMTAAAGCMVCFGMHDGKKTFWNWILGIGLAINFGDLILNLWSVESVSAPTKIEDYKLLMKSENDPSIDILSPFMRYYIGVIMSGAAVIAPYAVNLTLLLAMIDGAIKVAFDLISGDKIKFFVTMILKVGFFIFLIQSWVGTNSSYQLMPALSSGFETMGYTAGGAEEMVKEYDRANPDSNIEVQSNQIVTNALNFFNIFWEHAQQQNLLTIFIGLVCVVAAVVILFLTALEMFMVRIEFWTMALITIPLLPFGVIGQLKFLSEKAIGTMFHLAIKIFVVAFIATLSVNILTGLVENARETATSSDFIGNISYFLQVLLYALILFYMTKKIPELVSGLLSGNPTLSGGSMKEMAMSAARGAANAVSKGGGFTGAVVGGMRALSKSAGAMAPYGGKGNFGANALSFANAAGGKAMSMMGQAVKAGTNAALYRNPVYRGYQDAISLLGNKSNGLLTRPNANGGGTPEEILKNLSKGQTAPTVTQKISDTASTIKNVTSVAAQGISNTANNIKDAVQDLSQRIKK